MRTNGRRWAIGALAASLLALAPAAAPAKAPTIVHGGPEPAPLVESVPPAPRPGLSWVSGHWERNVVIDEWVWQPGHWQNKRGVPVGPGPVAESPGPLVAKQPWWHFYWFNPWPGPVGYGYYRW